VGRAQSRGLGTEPGDVRGHFALNLVL